MSNFNRFSRVNKFEKRRKNTKLISILMVAATILVILLIGLWLFGPDNEADPSTETSGPVDNEDNNENMQEDEGQNSSTTNDDSSQSNEEQSNNENKENQGNENEDSNQEVEETTVDANEEDDNVIRAFTVEDWEPIGTEQEGTHSINFEADSQDRIEMEKAIIYATGLSEDDMIPWWLARGGDQQVIATVSNRSETAIYRVYLNWIDNRGWQPTLVEILEENDQKWRFE